MVNTWIAIEGKWENVNKTQFPTSRTHSFFEHERNFRNTVKLIIDSDRNDYKASTC